MSVKTPPCVACGEPSWIDVWLSPDNTDLPRLAFCRAHADEVISYLRALVRPEHVPPPSPQATYDVRVTYRDAAGNDIEAPAGHVVTIRPADVPTIDGEWWPSDG